MHADLEVEIQNAKDALGKYFQLPRTGPMGNN